MIKSSSKSEVKIPAQYQGSFIKSVIPIEVDASFNENDLVQR